MSDYGHRLRQQATYDSEEQRTARKYFTPDKKVKQLDPSESEMEAALVASVAFNEESSYFPSAEQFICSYLNIELTDPASPTETGMKNAQLLKLAFKLSPLLKEQIDSGIAEEISLECGSCERRTILCHVGMFPVYDEREQSLIPEEGPRLIGIELGCSCKVYSVSDFYTLEQNALEIAKIFGENDNGL